jgi:xylose isomerase
MLPGSVNCWDLVETLFYLRQLKWKGWLCYDVLTRNGDVVEQMNATIAIMEAAEALLDKIGSDALRQCIDDGVPATTYRRLWEHLL